tara:strand:+ start:19538 stop:21532 length:1995 start_codon:yes stop_codon:yes gene_type:complete
MSLGEAFKEVESDQDQGLDDLPRIYRPLMWILCSGLVLFHIYTAGFGQMPPLSQRTVHVGLGLTIVFLGFSRLYFNKGRQGQVKLIIDAVCAILALITTVYILMEEQRITESFGIVVSPTELVFGSVLTLLLMIAAWRTTGPALPILALLMLSYTLFGQYIPGTWGHPGFEFKYLLEHLYLGTEGIWGTVTGLSANLIAIFIIFGAFLMATGTAQTFMDLALLVAGRFPGGAAKVATISSAMFGMLNGAAVANVASTGAFTIPAMKRLGYKPKFAAAVEATASSGGQITPPIMGAGAFVMAELLSVPYLDIVYAAAIPALLFYVCVWMSVDVEARRENMRAFNAAELPTRQQVLTIPRMGSLVLTLGVLLGSMFMGYTPTLAAFYAICTNVVVYLLIGLFQTKDVLMRLDNLQKGIISAAFGITGILALLVTSQIALSLIGLTGAGIKLSEMIVNLGGGDLLIGVLLAMGVALILGMGMPTTAAYLLAAAVAAPALISLGIEPLIAHFVVFYSALLSALTPPVCTAVFTAAVIAKTDWWSVSLVSIRLALMKYMMPLFFVFRPAVLLEAEPADIIWSLVMGFVASMLMAIGGGRFYRQKISLPFAGFLVVLGGLVAANQWWLDLIAILVLVTLVFVHRRAEAVRAKAKADAFSPAGGSVSGNRS